MSITASDGKYVVIECRTCKGFGTLPVIWNWDLANENQEKLGAPRTACEACDGLGLVRLRLADIPIVDTA